MPQQCWAGGATCLFLLVWKISEFSICFADIQWQCTSNIYAIHLAKGSPGASPRERQLTGCCERWRWRWSDWWSPPADRTDRRWSAENKNLISGKQCKIETAARHKNCSLARLTLSHFHRTTNDQFVTFPLDHFYFSAIFTNVYRFHFPPYRHFGIYVLSGMLFHLKYIPHIQYGS